MLEFRNEPLARHGHWRIGGPMERFCIVDSMAELIQVGTIDHVLGNGSNLLVPDEGLLGTTVRLGAGFRELTLSADVEGATVVRAGAGLLNAVLLHRLARMDLGGLACLAGVPGSIGGAIAMNAGTALGEIADCIVRVEGFFTHGPKPVLGQGSAGEAAVIQTLPRSALAMRYREGGLPAGLVITTATLAVSRHNVGVEQARITEHLSRRKATQPLDLPSCGSVFRNPPGDHAGRLIESVGLKGWRMGNAQISPKHANFIVNLGDATALDVMCCIRTVWERVAAETGVRLVAEVHVMGQWPAELWPLPTERTGTDVSHHAAPPRLPGA